MTMSDGFVTVFSILDTGYRGLPWALGILTGVLLALLYIVWLPSKTVGDRCYRYGLLAVVSTIAIVCLSYHLRGYRQFQHLAQVLQNDQAAAVQGNIGSIRFEDYYLLIDINGLSLRSSRYEWPYRLGFHSNDFPLQPTYLVRFYQVDDVIVKLQIHQVHL